MKTIIFLALAFISAAILGLAHQYGVSAALWVTSIGAGIAAVMIIAHFMSSSPPALSGTRRVQRARAIYEDRPIEDMSRLSIPGNHGQQPSMHIPSLPMVVPASNTPPAQLRLGHNAWPQIPLQQSGQRQRAGGKALTMEELAQLIDQMNRAK